MFSRKKLLQFISGNKRILIVGNGPDKKQLLKSWSNHFEIVVRINNYIQHFQSGTDIYFSYFGRNIKKSVEVLKREGVKFLINKYPNANMQDTLKDYPISDKDYRWVYELRKNWWFTDVIALTAVELKSQILLLDKHMPTTGFSCVDFFVRILGVKVTIVGFDCFTSNIHNDVKWDKSGNHNTQKEKEILTQYHQKGLIEWIQSTKTTN